MVGEVLPSTEAIAKAIAKRDKARILPTGSYAFKPPDKYIKLWEADYKKMQEEMIPGESPSFDKLIASVKHEVDEYNNLINFCISEIQLEI